MRQRMQEQTCTKVHPMLLGGVKDHRDPRSGRYGGHYCFFAPDDDESMLSVIFDGCVGRGVGARYGYRVDDYGSADGINGPCVTVEQP